MAGVLGSWFFLGCKSLMVRTEPHVMSGSAFGSMNFATSSYGHASLTPKGPRWTHAICLQPWMCHAYWGKEAAVPTYNKHPKQEEMELSVKVGMVGDSFVGQTL